MLATAGLTAGALIAATARAADVSPTIGAPAPAFTATDINGEAVALSDFADKTVVIEFNNPECPYVMRHYQGTGNMPRLQAEATGEGVVWLTINSSAEGLQGYRDEEGYKAYLAETEASPSHAILDHSGAIGHLYAAKATPHMYVIDKGTLVYQGAIDDRATASRNEGVEGAHNYVRAALDAIAAGEPVETAQTTAYGCAMKFAS
jgi:peroxiredoxin